MLRFGFNSRLLLFLFFVSRRSHTYTYTHTHKPERNEQMFNASKLNIYTVRSTFSPFLPFVFSYLFLLLSFLLCYLQFHSSPSLTFCVFIKCKNNKNIFILVAFIFVVVVDVAVEKQQSNKC